MDVETPSKSGGSAMVPVFIGIVGILLGAAALFIALNSRSTATEASASLSSDVANLTATVKTLQKANADANDTLSKLADTTSGLSSRIQTVSTSVDALKSSAQSTLTQLGTMVSEDRTQIKAQSESIQQIVAKLTAPPPAATAIPASGGSSAAATPPPPGGQVHTVASGEFLGTIARKYGVTVDAIETANPGLNPNRMQVGQKINIPPPTPKAPAGGATATPAGN
jgi:LysM repeat protein